MKRFGFGIFQDGVKAITSLTVPFSEQNETITGQEEMALVNAARTNPQAFDKLYQRYLGPVYRYLCLHTNTREDAADLTQQVFLQALKALPSYRKGQLPFSAWLFRIAHNLAVYNFRRARPTVTWDLLPESEHPASEQYPETTLLEQEQLLQLRNLFNQLDADKRELLALRFAAGFTAREIGVILGKREEAVQKQLSRILQGLRKQYKEQAL
jgi:RNA polymerase sigma-70 factor (ECF subfamily)